MQPLDCPDGWDYEDVPGHRDVLARETAAVIKDLRRGSIATDVTAADSRSVHARLFHALTPRDHRYFAGDYRGQSFKCLEHYEVGIKSDPRVGTKASAVIAAMGQASATISAGLAAIDAAHKIPNAQLSPEEKLKFLVAFACHVLELFLRIHPYANGNGHAGRFIIWAILGRYNRWPVRWTIEPRPPDPPYTQLISRHRDGDKEPLEEFVLSCLD
jgi:fido (protein-threonine AMPylation protein)